MIRYEISGNGMAAQFTRTLQNAGFNVGDERDMQMGMLAYNAAMLVWRKHNDGRVQGKFSSGPIEGRNSPCPCGSGVKYKKCCLRKHESQSQSAIPRTAMSFNPNLIPRLWGVHGMQEDCKILNKLMESDEDLRRITFSRNGVEAFLAKMSKERKVPTDKDAFETEIDELACKYAAESGEGKIVAGLTDRFLAAATRVRTDDELRGLATGVCFSMMAKSSKDFSDDILSILLFRRAFTQVILPSVAVDKIINQLGGDSESIRKRIEAHDPSVFEEFRQGIDSLGEAEKNALLAHVEGDQDELWEVISKDRFPVAVPFSTMLPFWLGLYAIAKDGRDATSEELQNLIERISAGLVDDDYKLFEVLLTRWIDENPEEDIEVRKAVETMAGLCKSRMLEAFMEALAVRCVKNSLFEALDEAEEKLIADWKEPFDNPDFLRQYSEWLRSIGYPQLADRTLSLGGLKVLPESSSNSEALDNVAGAAPGLALNERPWLLDRLGRVFK